MRSRICAAEASAQALCANPAKSLSMGCLHSTKASRAASSSGDAQDLCHLASPRNPANATIAPTSIPQYLLNPSSNSFFLPSPVPSLTASR